MEEFLQTLRALTLSFFACPANLPLQPVHYMMTFDPQG